MQHCELRLSICECGPDVMKPPAPRETRPLLYFHRLLDDKYSVPAFDKITPLTDKLKTYSNPDAVVAHRCNFEARCGGPFRDTLVACKPASPEPHSSANLLVNRIDTTATMDQLVKCMSNLKNQTLMSFSNLLIVVHNRVPEKQRFFQVSPKRMAHLSY